MRSLRLVLAVIAVACLQGCDSTSTMPSIEAELLLKDSIFVGAERVQIEPAEQVFALNAEALAFVEHIAKDEPEPNKRMKRLVKELFDRSSFNLLYVSHANSNAADTFNNRAANCLSMSILAYALAKESELQVQFQEVEVPEYWTYRQGYSLLNGHINLVLAPRLSAGLHYYRRSGLEVDFDPLSPKNPFPKHFISKEKVLAMYYNNKGADALIESDWSSAYAHFKAALTTYPTLSPAWVNLGYLYRFSEQPELAEASYRQALAIDEDNLTAWENLAVLKESLGQTEEAQRILLRVQFKREKNPYYHHMLGERMYAQQQWQQAIKHFRDAIKLNDKPHEFYFGLAKTYYQLGDLDSSERYLKLAKRHSYSDLEEHTYQSKLDLLTRL